MSDREWSFFIAAAALVFLFLAPLDAPGGRAVQVGGTVGCALVAAFLAWRGRPPPSMLS